MPAKSPPKGKGKRAKFPSGRDYTKKQSQVRKAEKGKDYGWLDFLSLPKMKLPNFLGFNSDKQKALKASKAGEEGGQVPVILVQSISSSKQPNGEIYFPGRSWEKKNLEKAPTNARSFITNWLFKSSSILIKIKIEKTNLICLQACGAVILEYMNC